MPGPYTRTLAGLGGVDTCIVNGEPDDGFENVLLKSCPTVHMFAIVQDVQRVPAHFGRLDD